MMNIIGFIFIALHFCDGLPTEFSPPVNSSKSAGNDTDAIGEHQLSPVVNELCQSLSLLNQIVFITQLPDHVDLSTCVDQEFQDEQICLHVRFASFKVTLFGKVFIIDVELNHDFLPSMLMETVYHTEGSGVKAEVTLENCFYQGRVRGIFNSLVALSTCRGLSGYIITNEDLYSIYPLDVKCSNSQVPHKIVKLSPPASLPYGNKSMMFKSYQRHEQHASECLRNVKISKPRLESLMKNVSTTKILRVAFVCDYSLMRRLDKYAIGIKPFFIELANLMNALLLELKGPKLRLVYIEAWNSSGAFSKSWDYRSMLSEFLRYRQTAMDYGEEFDVAHLWTAREFGNSGLGIAVKDSICTNRAVSVSQVTDVKDLLLVALPGLDAILSVLGSEESSSDSCPCNNPMLCFTEPVIETRLPWLPGSPRAIFLSTLTRLDVCLYDSTATPTYYQNCGNGIVERGEECDCIDKERCRFTDPCCDPELCLLVPWTNCRQGDCCHNCTLRSTNEVCRVPLSECDVPEFCDGKSGECPFDAMVQDGQECLTGVGSCYSGSCVSFDKQCHRLWDKEATGAADDCYETFNVAGNFDGHCGWDPLTGMYKRCNLRDVKCGLLHCAGGSSRPLIGRNHIMSTGVSNGKSYECKIVNGEHEDGTHMLGMVQDGSLCSDNGGLCVNGKCVNLNQSTCPIDELGNVCSGNGVCTTQVRCFCSHGFTGLDCALRVSRTSPLTTVTPKRWQPDQLVVRDRDFNTTGNSSVVTEIESEFHVSSGIGAVWLVFMLASIVIVSIILFVVCLACYRRRSPPARRKHKSHPYRTRRNSNTSNSQHSSRVKFHNELPSYRAYKLRHFLRGSGASETESEKTGGQPCSEKTNGTDAVTVEQPVPLSAVDRLSLHPERGILKNSSLNRRREEKSSIANVSEEVAMVNKDSSCELKLEDCSVVEPLVNDVVVTKTESNPVVNDCDVNQKMLVETDLSQSPNFVKLRQSSPCYVKKLKASPSSIRNSRRD